MSAQSTRSTGLTWLMCGVTGIRGSPLSHTICKGNLMMGLQPPVTMTKWKSVWHGYRVLKLCVTKSKMNRKYKSRWYCLFYRVLKTLDLDSCWQWVGFRTPLPGNAMEVESHYSSGLWHSRAECLLFQDYTLRRNVCLQHHLSSCLHGYARESNS